MATFLTILEYVLAVVLILLVLIQPSKQDGLRGFIGAGQDTFFSKNKARTSEVLYARLTVIVMSLLAINTILMNIIK